ncbi:dicarboxylate/amino acid:cation symporter [Achromobacter denitrificans]|jgi:aerobic C4-dicarboxylate transport protein|uniref:C4-dicarboxylate transport protein n=1 Tax=Achromobacter denitrificans TaxID=32002 RepID=A0A6J5C9U0_ACHDE|nr:MULTISPECIES: dicarboxylate/amino acid:cation symporter [Achromobacter]ASC62892.1 dicarboxylate/amino acid:cation symporter [Achromobacter denitrificans]MBV2157500.1 dicarboxylate/amino acid:cation symporter [Achromobacter denitrificans]MDF3847741.1 dicarboxylate/amino acid:cation symporter [Achromobacter denitrificans]MDF3860687.1 dicarboxylate/amino acid:cation symporter [Achromobacter denitrificans]MDF3940659.1 dicarboxylate/amino acid:cation symporter [Achromobacter denitrificans]
MIDVDQVAPARKLKFYQILYVQVIFAIVVGVALGALKPELGQQMQPLGDAFIKLVKMIIAPVIFLTVATGIAAMSDLKKVGRVAGKAMLYFLIFSTLALIVGMIVSHIVQPGAGMHIDPKTLDEKAVSGYVAKAHDSTITGFLMNVIPTTIFSPFVGGDILQVLFVAVLFGISLAMVGERGKPILTFMTALAQPIFKLVAILMKAAPIGAFGAMAFTIGKYGIKSVVNLAMLVGTFYATSVLFVVVVLGLVARYNGFSILKLVRYIREELLLVLGTSSSEAALPTLMQKMERAGCSKSVVGLVVPTGYSFNLDGTNIYMTMAALFIAQACDIPLSLGDQILLLLVAMLSSKGAAGVTGAGFITLAATLSVVPSVPVAGMALILGVDRFMSECRALTNLVGNATAAVVVARWEGELDTAQLHAALEGELPPPQPAVEARQPVLGQPLQQG